MLTQNCAESTGSNRCRNGSNFRCKILCKNYCRNRNHIWAVNVQLLLEAYGQGAECSSPRPRDNLHRSSLAPAHFCNSQLSSTARVGTEFSILHLQQQISEFQTPFWKIKEYLLKYSEIKNHWSTTTFIRWMWIECTSLAPLSWHITPQICT